VIRLYEVAYQRPPTAEEVTLAESFVERSAGPLPEPTPAATWLYGTGRFNSESQKVENWQALPHFTGDAWQWEPKLPASNGQWTLLNRQGGHPGSDASNAAIRRWVAPFDGQVSINGELEHPAEAGDGIRGRVVSSRSGPLADWKVFHGKTRTELALVEVQTGDTIDFLVEPGENENSDSFNWKLTLRRLGAGSGSSAADWQTARDFGGPQRIPRPLDSWQQYAQVLLSANEFVFVD